MVNRAEYAVHLRAMWLGECIANWTGIRTEGRRSEPPFFIDADWGTCPFPDRPGLCIDYFLWGNPWNADDDTDIEYVYHYLHSTLGVTRLTPQQIASGWITHISRRIWVANANARSMMSRGTLPPMTAAAQGLASNVAHPIDESLMIDAQLTTEFFGAMCPGMPDRALAMADLPIRTTSRGYATHASQFYVVLYALAPMVDRTLSGREQAIWLVRQARKFIPDTSKSADIADFVLADFLANPDVNDWESTRDKIYQRYRQNAPASGFIYRDWFESSVNFATGVMCLLYGQMNFDRTVQIGTLGGWDSDNPTATMGGLVALIQGPEFLATYGWCADTYKSSETRDNLPDFTPALAGDDTFTLMAARMLPVIDLEVAQAGGRVSTSGGKNGSGDWLLPPGGAGDGLSPADALASSPTQQLWLRSANNQVPLAGGSVTASSNVPGAPYPGYGSGDPAFIANGEEHDFRGLEDNGSRHAIYSTLRPSGPTPGPHVLSVEYDRPVSAHTVRFIAGDYFLTGGVQGGWASSAALELRVGGTWIAASVPQPPTLDANQPFQIVDFVLAQTVQVTGVRVSLMPAPSATGPGYVTCMELDVLAPAATSSGAPTFDINADGVVDIDDLYAMQVSPRDINTDGVADAADTRYLEAYLRWNEAAGMAAGLR